MASARTYLRIPVLWMLGHLPGRIGRRAETGWFWALRKLRAGSSAQAFAKAVAQLQPDSICIDFGANEGKFTRMLAARAGHVHAFEPDPWAFARLREACADVSNVTLHNAAIGATDGTVAMMRDPMVGNEPWRSQGTSVYRSHLWADGTPERFDVHKVGIAGFLRRLDREVSIVKMDIEGAEVEVLEALRDSPELARVHRIFAETHEPQFPELRARLRSLRQRARSIERPSIDLDWE